MYRYRGERRKHLKELTAPAVIEGTIEKRLVDELISVDDIVGHTRLDPESPVRYAVTGVLTTFELHDVARAQRPPVPRQVLLPIPVTSPKNVTEISPLGATLNQRHFGH